MNKANNVILNGRVDWDSIKESVTRSKTVADAIVSKLNSDEIAEVAKTKAKEAADLNWLNWPHKVDAQLDNLIKHHTTEDIEKFMKTEIIKVKPHLENCPESILGLIMSLIEFIDIISGKKD